MRIIITEKQLNFLLEQDSKVLYREPKTTRPIIGGDITDCEKILSTFEKFRGDRTQYQYNIKLTPIRVALNNISINDFKEKYPDYFDGNRFLEQDFILHCANSSPKGAKKEIINNIKKYFKPEKHISASGLGGTKGGGTSRIGSGQSVLGGSTCPGGVNQAGCSRPDR